MVSPARVIGLVSLAGLLGWALWEASWQPRLPAAPEPVNDTDTLTAAPPASVTPLGDYAVTLQRPLFFPGRRPPGDQAAEVPAAGSGPAPVIRGESPLPSLSAVIEEGEQRSALLTAPGQAAGTRLRAGEELGGWRLVRIEDDSVILESNGRREEVPLRSYGSAPRPAPVRPRNTRPPRLVRPAAGNNGELPPE